MIESNRPAHIKPPSERSFGFVFAAVFAVIALLPLLKGHGPRIWAIGLALAFALVAGLAPKLLAPLNRLWFRFGLLLHKFVNPMVMGAIYGLVIIPAGLIMRASKKDPLRLRREPQADSYWIKRDPAGPAAESMTHPF
jgi:predicted membrane metal-binding protein